MLLAERGGALPDILATDISAAAVARARTGTYTQFEIQRGLPVRRMVRWFEGEGNRWTASPTLLSTITYRRQNLVADPFPAGTFDLILCRNVLFYLTPAARERVLEGLARALTADGYLLGAGETVIGQSSLLRPSRRARGLYERADTP
ncbi:CheR family methyltransferase [Sphingomonas sp. MMS24-JH45]